MSSKRFPTGISSLVPFREEAIFRHKVFRMLLAKGKITRELIAMLSSWRHSGFHVFCGNRISPNDETAMENLARYIIRASFSQERMQYLDQEGKVVYASKDGKSIKVFPAMEWLAAMCWHIPNRGEQMVRYYGYYSNVVRGKRQQEGIDDAIPCILEPQGNEKAFRKSWARLIPLTLQRPVIPSTPTPTTLGMPIFMHNASSKKACRRGLPELCSKMPS